MRDLINVRYLWLQKNRLTELSTAVCCLPGLRYAHFENNMIESISDAVGCMSRLKGLWAGF
jgi:Leucine-rich repeat (LRR) protein